MVVIISGGSVVEMPWEKECDAILHGCLAGQADTKAIWNILTGNVNSSGKLAETYPLKYEDCPNSSYYLGNELTSEYRESIYVGYRYFDKADIPVKYPFRYGLSYTSYSYSDLIVSNEGAKFTIINTGDMAGSEITQLYIGRKQEDIYIGLRRN